VTDNPKIRYYPPFTGSASSRPMTPEEQQCDCGCMDVERGPVEDLTYYAEPIVRSPKEAGVEPGYIVIRSSDEPTAEVARAAMLHDGEGNAVVQIDHDSWQHGTIRGDQ
jgi:hypothetical protein